MALTITFDELLRYTNSERDRWRSWFTRHAAALDAPLQPNDRFHTVGKLIDHIFLGERRFLQRLTDMPLSSSTGLTGNNVQPLFDYGASVRRELEQFAATIDVDTADEVRAFEILDQPWTLSPRKILFHVVLHETRHWAQIALAVRLAGFEPPGNHDLLFSSAIR
jgi:uncharacterized damage-inducible protein DinB